LPPVKRMMRLKKSWQSIKLKEPMISAKLINGSIPEGKVKKLFLGIVLALFISATAFADHEGFGIGVVGGGGGGNGHGNGIVGLSLKTPALPVFWGIYFNFSSGYTGIGITGDYYIIDSPLINKTLNNEDGLYDLKIDWYLGLGGFFNLYSSPDTTKFNAGVRVPVGISWHIIRQLEMFAAIAPGIGISNWQDNILYLGINGEIGLRFWM